MACGSDNASTVGAGETTDHAACVRLARRVCIRRAEKFYIKIFARDRNSFNRVILPSYQHVPTLLTRSRLRRSHRLSAILIVGYHTINRDRVTPSGTVRVSDIPDPGKLGEPGSVERRGADPVNFVLNGDRTPRIAAAAERPLQ